LLAFEQNALHLTTSTRIKAFVDKTASPEPTAESRFSRIWQFLWPDTPLIARPAVSYLVILLLIIPAYIGIGRLDRTSVRELHQVVHLTPNRSAQQALVRAGENDALLTFRFDGYQPGRSYDIEITSEDSSTVFAIDEFASFDRRGIGYISLSLPRMVPGRYQLTITGTGQDSGRVFQQYQFSIED
jgi:hypothetical protein